VAIEMLATGPAVADQPGLSVREFERITRAVGGGQAQVAAAIVEGADELLACDAAVLLRPTQRADVHAVTRAPGEGSEALHERWELGPEAPRLFERACHAPDGWRAPWSGLRMRLRGMNVRSWASVPLQCEGHAEPLGALVVGAHSEGRPCGRMHRLPDFALSASAALAATDDCGADIQPTEARGREHLRRVGSLAFGVSHSLGNIFGAILGNLHFLEEEASSDEQRELIARVVQSTAQGIELMHDLQLFTHAPVASEMGVVDLSRLAAEVADLAMRLCGHWPGCRGVEIDTELGAAAPVWGDRSQLRDSIVALVFNAVQAVGREGRVVVRSAREGRTSEVRVIDDGPGMTDDVLRRATEPFFSTHPTLHQGLGLTLARAVAVGHRGALTLHRARTGGTQVTFRLPQDPPAEERSEMLPSVSMFSTTQHRKGHTR